MRRATALAAVLVVAAVVAVGIRWAPDIGSASPDGSLACSVKASCGAGEVQMFRMSSTGNAHAGTPGGSSYGNVVCCGDVTGLGTSCSGVYDTVLTLSAADNAHVASDGSYGTEVCVSGNGDDATADVAYTVGDCPAEYACLATISGSMNAHVADCDGVDDYATKVCGLVTGDNCPMTPNPGQENADSDQWGDACDNCPATATVWVVPIGDGDCDGFPTADEGVITTDPADACADTPDPDDEADDKWPPDFNDDQLINLVDLNKLLPAPLGHWGETPASPGWSPRYDLVPDGVINLPDLNKTLPAPLGTWGEICTP